MGLIQNMYRGAKDALQRGRDAVNGLAERSSLYRDANSRFMEFQNDSVRKAAGAAVATALIAGSALLSYGAFVGGYSKAEAQELRRSRPAVTRTVEQQVSRDVYVTPQRGEGLWKLVERAETEAKRQNPDMTITGMSAGKLNYQNVKESDRAVANIVKEIQYDGRNKAAGISDATNDTVVRPGYYAKGSEKFTPTGQLQAGQDGLDDRLSGKRADGTPQRIYVGTAEGTMKNTNKTEDPVVKTIGTYAAQKAPAEKHDGLPLAGLAGILGAGALGLYLTRKNEGTEATAPGTDPSPADGPGPKNGKREGTATERDIIDAVFNELNGTWEVPVATTSVDAVASELYRAYDDAFREAGANEAYRTGARALMNPALREGVALAYYANPIYALQANKTDGKRNESYLSLDEVARLTGVSAYRIRKLADEQGLSRRALQQEYRSHRMEEAVLLEVQGLNATQIAERLGVSASTVRRDLKKTKAAEKAPLRAAA